MDVSVGMYPYVSPEAEPDLPMIQERRCPACRSEEIKNTGHVIAGAGVFKSAHRCDPCGTAFWFVRKTRSSPDSRYPDASRTSI